MSWSERAIVLEALLLLAALSPALRLARLQTVYRTLGRLSRGGSAAAADADRPDPARAEAVARLVDAATRHAIGRPTCLHRSLALWWMLRRRGLDARLRIGVRSQEDRVEGHAWVEYGESVLNEGAHLTGYTRLSWMAAGPDL
jgi:hypothetical protein